MHQSPRQKPEGLGMAIDRKYDQARCHLAIAGFDQPACVLALKRQDGRAFVQDDRIA